MSDDHFSVIGKFAGTLCCVAAFDCNLHFDKYGGILMWIAMMLYMFKALGTICDEYFVPSLEVIVDKLQLSNDVAGATFMAAGSSAPELFTSLVSTFLIVNEGGVGTIVGSAIFNILVIVGATGYIACKEKALKIWWYPLCRDCFFYVLSIAELMFILSDEKVEWYEGVIMFLTYLLYCLYMKFNPKIVARLGLIEPSAASVHPISDANSSAIDVMEKPTGDITSTPVQATNGTTDDSPLKAEAIEQSPLRAVAMGDAGAVEETRQPEVGGRGRDTPGTVNTVDDFVKEVSDEKKESPDCTVVTMKVGQNCGLLEAPNVSPRERRRPSWGYAETSKKDETKPGGSPEKGQPAYTEEQRPAPLVSPEEEPSEKKGWLRDPLDVIWELTMPAPDRAGGACLFTMSILYIGLCTYFMVDATNRVGVVLHIPTLAMALIFLAAGTSIPDALGSIAVAKQGEGDMAVANALGSNVFDILIGLGVPWTIKTGFMGKEVSFPGKWDELVWDILVLVLVLFIFVGCLIAHKWHLTRRVGILLLCFYLCFIVYNIFAIWVIDPPLKKQEAEAHCDTI